MPDKNRITEVNELLDELDNEIMRQYPEIENDWLHYAIAKKVQLEIERMKLIGE